MNTLRLTQLTAAASAVLALLGCAAPQGLSNTTGAVVDNLSKTVQTASAKEALPVTKETSGTPSATQAAIANPAPVARWAKKPWHGARFVDVQNDEILPPVFYEPRTLNFDDRASRGRVPLAIVAERLTRITGIPVRVKADVQTASPIGRSAPPPPQTLQGTQAQSPGASPITISPMPGAPSGSGPIVIPAVQSQGGSPSNSSAMSIGVSPSGLNYAQPLTDLSSVDMRWSGTLAGFLDHVTAILGLSWSYRDNSIVIERFQTDTFELSIFAGSQDFKMSLSSGNQSSGSAGGSSGGSSSNMDLTESGRIQVLQSLKSAIESMVVPSGGQVVLNEGTGRFFVTATRDVMGRVRQVIQSEDAALQRQAHIQIDIYSVISNQSDQLGMNWSLVFNDLATAWGAVVKSPSTLVGASTATMGVSILSAEDGSTRGTRFGKSSAMLDALNQYGRSAQLKPISMIALNRQWARKTNLRTDGYVSETTPGTATSTGAGAPGLKTSSITTGDKFMVQPAILDNGSIVLKFGVSLTELLQMLTVSSGSGTTLQSVQTPLTSGTDDQATVKLNPGEAMVVTGLSRQTASSDQRTLADGLPVAMGGSRTLGAKREDFIIVIRATPI